MGGVHAANVVADALSRKTRCTIVCLIHGDCDAMQIFASLDLN